jgi:hypothetical protein
MLTVENSGVLVQGAPQSGGDMPQTVRAVVIRGVYARANPGEPVKPWAEGAILNLTPRDFAELRSSNYVMEAPPEQPKAALERKHGVES